MHHHSLILGGHLTNSVHSPDGSDPSEIWSNLKSRFEIAIENRKIDLKNNLSTLQMEEGMTTEQYLTALDYLVV